MKLFGNVHDTGLRQRCSKLIQSLGIWKPDLREILKARQAALDQAVQGNFWFWHIIRMNGKAQLSVQ